VPLRELAAVLESLRLCVRSPHMNPTSPGRGGVSPQASHRQDGIPRHTAAHLLG